MAPVAVVGETVEVAVVEACVAVFAAVPPTSAVEPQP